MNTSNREKRKGPQIQANLIYRIGSEISGSREQISAHLLRSSCTVASTHLSQSRTPTVFLHVSLFFKSLSIYISSSALCLHIQILVLCIYNQIQEPMTFCRITVFTKRLSAFILAPSLCPWSPFIFPTACFCEASLLLSQSSQYEPQHISVFIPMAACGNGLLPGLTGCQCLT